MKFELKLIILSELNRTIFDGILPPIPNEIKDSFFNLSSFVRTVNKESIEHFRASFCWGVFLLPMMVNSVIWSLVQIIVTFGEGVR